MAEIYKTENTRKAGALVSRLSGNLGSMKFINIVTNVTTSSIASNTDVLQNRRKICSIITKLERFSSILDRVKT